MLRPHSILLLMLAALTAVIFWSCDRMSGDVNENKPPTVQFVNTPLDNSQFNYAPIVYWIGYDPDGFITAYQFLDDTSTEARTIYHADTLGQHLTENYLNSRPATSWTTTQNTQETIYLLTVEGDTTEHLFAVRSVDNLGATSVPRVRTFFRTNQAPNTPQIKRTPMDNYDTEQAYSDSFVVADTLLLADSPIATWPGIQFVWKGTDPDSRELNIIPLEFSYLLTNTSTGQVMPFERFIDSTHSEWVHDWSDWNEKAQLILSEQVTHGEMETGNYKFELRVRDDGLTLSDRNATAWFTAIRPSFDKQLLIVDENKPMTGPIEPIRGGYSDSLILAFYYNMIPQAFQLAEIIRPYVDDNFDGVPDIPEPFVYDTSATGPVQWFRNKTLETSIPWSLIQQFKWVWVIGDDNSAISPGPGIGTIEARQKAMARYMDVGGQVMISGRKVFAGSYNLPTGNVNLCTNAIGNFFCRYFNLQTANCKGPFNANQDVADFGGATTANALMPDVVANPAVVCSLRWGSSHYCCLPEVDYFGRNTSSSGYDFSETLYNYTSCTDTASGVATNIDCAVQSSTPTQAILLPAPGHTRILQVTRVDNLTRGVSGEVMGIRNEGGTWEIVVSTPAEAGAWQDSDTLSVDYTYIPISINHDQPVGARFIRIEGILYVNPQNGEISFVGLTRFRTVIFTFPLSFLDPTPVYMQAYGTEVNPVAAIVASQLLFFNAIKRFDVGRGEG